MVFKFKNKEYNLSSRTHIMGILNITPDSFSDGGKYFSNKLNIAKIVEDAVQMEKDGADFVDVGGESTRPGAEEVSLDEELSRVIPAIEAIIKNVKIPVSIDTYKSKVAVEALQAGAEIVNDISGFRFDSQMANVTAKHKASCVLMHIKGLPKNMQENPEYIDVVDEVKEYLLESAGIAENAGIKQIIIDPGIGFGKKLKHNLTLINNIIEIKKTGYAVLIGLSNKRFIDNISTAQVNERLEGTIAANVASIMNGANIIRVHNVLSNKKAAVVADAILRNVK